MFKLTFDKKLHALCFILATAALATKIHSFSGLPGALLWAEDGPVFISQAFNLGIESLITTYAGYYHAYPRIFAFISSFFPLQYAPWILTFGWLVVYFLMVSMVVRVARLKNASVFSVILLVLIVFFQHNSFEVILNITNSQWLITVILTLRFIFDLEFSKNRVIDAFVVFLFSLSGPSGIFLIPALIVKAIYRIKKSKKYHHDYSYYTLISASSIQFIILLLSPRLDNYGESLDFVAFISKTFQAMFFNGNIGGEMSFLFLAGGVLWTIATVYFIKNNDKDEKINALLLFFSSSVFLLTSLILVKKIGDLNMTRGSAGRYIYAPIILNTILFFYLTLKSKLANTGIMVAIAIIIFSNYPHRIDRDRQFSSYEKFSRVKQNVLIPIAPHNWFFDAQFNFQGVESKPDRTVTFSHDTKMILIEETGEYFPWDEILYKKSTDDHLFNFRDPVSCANATDLGIDIEIDASMGGTAEKSVLVLWSYDGTSFDARRHGLLLQFRRAAMQAALPLQDGKVYLRFHRVGSEEIKINKLQFYCLN